jgi:hypothetical protein
MIFLDTYYFIMRPTNIFGPKRRDFHGETVKLCETAEALVQSNLFSGALEKILEPQDVQYIQAIVAKRVAGQELNPREEAYLSGIESDDVLLSKFNDIINTIEYISKKR